MLEAARTLLLLLLLTGCGICYYMLLDETQTKQRAIPKKVYKSETYTIKGDSYESETGCGCFSLLCSVNKKQIRTWSESCNFFFCVKNEWEEKNMYIYEKRLQKRLQKMCTHEHKTEENTKQTTPIQRFLMADRWFLGGKKSLMPNVTFLPWKKQNTAAADLQWRSAHPDTGRPNKIQPTVGAMSLESLASPRSNAGTVDGQTASAVQGQTWSFQPGLGRIGDRPNNLTNANDWSTERHLRFSQLPLLFVQVQKTGQVVTLAKKKLPESEKYRAGKV